MADRYQVREEIGSGATAITYRGWDERLERFVAIKILRQHVAGDDVFVRRFEREARAAASVSHGNVVDVYDVGREAGVLYIVMQLVEGEDLKHLIQREAPLSSTQVRAIIGQVLDGLGAIHRAGIIHRDIKPQNILLGRDGVARLTDFGIAQAGEDTGMTTAGTTVGTAAYMAPEQAQAGHLTEATDLYGVGVMMYEMLTGFLPFTGGSNMAVMLEHIRTPPLPPSQRMPGAGITPAIDAVVLQALSKNPEDRFPTARAMKQAAMRALSGGGYDDARTTVVTPAATRTRATRSVAPVTPHAPPLQRMEASSPPPVEAGREGSALGGVVAGFALLLLLAVAGIAGWYAYDYWNDSRQGNDPTPTVTVPAVVPTATTAPTATDAPALIEPIETEAPTTPPEPTATEEPTAPPPTETPEPEPTETEVPPLIEPIDGTPLAFTPEPGSGEWKRQKDQEKEERKQEKERDKQEKQRQKDEKKQQRDSRGTGVELAAAIEEMS